MYRPIFLYIGIKIFFNIRDRFYFLISLISTLLIAFSVMSLITMLSISNGFEKELEDNIIRLIPQAILTNKNCKVSKKELYNTNISSIKDVSHYSTLVTSEILIQSEKNICSGTMLGINMKDPEILFKYIINSKKVNLCPGKYQIVLGYELAKKLSVQENDLVNLFIPEINQYTSFRMILREKTFTVSGIFFSNSEVDNYQVLINQEDASKLMHYPNGFVTGLRFWFKKPINIIKRKRNKFHINSLFLHDWTEKKGELLQSIYMEENMMQLLLILITILSTFSIIALINFIVVDRKTEIAILKTYGLKKIDIILIFLLQGTLYCIFGNILGIGLGIFLSKKINFIFFNILKNCVFLSVYIEYKQIVLIFILTVVITLLSIIYSSLKSSKYDPCEILFYE